MFAHLRRLHAAQGRCGISQNFLFGDEQVIEGFCVLGAADMQNQVGLLFCRFRPEEKPAPPIKAAGSFSEFLGLFRWSP